MPPEFVVADDVKGSVGGSITQVEMGTSDGSFATESVRKNESLTRTNQTDSSLLFVSFVLRLDSTPDPLVADGRCSFTD